MFNAIACRRFARRSLLAGLLAALLLPAGPLRAETPALPPILDAEAVPHLRAAGRADYVRFLQQATPRAFALGPGGAWGWAAALETPEATRARALEICARTSTAGPCRLYASDLDIVWPGQEAPAPRAPEARPLAAGPGWVLLPDSRFLWQGPGAARGAYVWAHGRSAGGQDSRGSQPQPHVRVFNNAGYDVFRFDRAPETDETEAAAAWMRAALEAVRARGYARLVVGGQSRGAWNALQALAVPGLADAVVAIAPAAHGAAGSPAWAWAVEDLRLVLDAANSPGARIVVATFAGDEYDPDPEARAALFRGLAPPRIGATLLLDRPPELRGHGGGAESRFTLRYGACLFDFVEGRAAACP